MKIVTIASTLTGNKGASAMFVSVAEMLERSDKKAELTMLSYYPKKDKKINSYKNVQVQNAKPLYLGLVINPGALLYFLIPFLRPLLRKLIPEIKSISEADVFLDQGGITFVDGREKFLLFNVATILPALFVGTPVVKCSQAMGPFNGRVNRTIASLILPKMDKIFARGEITFQHLKSLKLKNVELASDLAFSLPSPNNVLKRNEIKNLKTYTPKNKTTVGISPSVVMEKSLKNSNVDYCQILASIIDHIIKDYDFDVLLIPHSSRPGSTKLHNNDLPICDKIFDTVQNKMKCRVVQNEYNALELRYLIGNCTYYISSRFHAMISAISMQTPVLVMGWNHKYEEVLKEFDLGNFAIVDENFEYKKIKNSFKMLVKNKLIVRKKIEEGLQKARQSSNQQLVYILDNFSKP